MGALRAQLCLRLSYVLKCAPGGGASQKGRHFTKRSSLHGRTRFGKVGPPWGGSNLLKSRRPALCLGHPGALSALRALAECGMCTHVRASQCAQTKSSRKFFLLRPCGVVKVRSILRACAPRRTLVVSSPCLGPGYPGMLISEHDRVKYCITARARLVSVSLGSYSRSVSSDVRHTCAHSISSPSECALGLACVVRTSCVREPYCSTC